MSFRNRLTFFFILLVILPVLAVASVGILIVRDSEEGKNDAALEQAQRAADGLYSDSRERAEVVAADGQHGRRRSRSPCATTTAPRSSGGSRSSPSAAAPSRVRLTLDGEEPVEAGGGDAVAPARSRVVDADGDPAGQMDLSVTTADDYADLLARVTGHDVLLTAERPS